GFDVDLDFSFHFLLLLPAVFQRKLDLAPDQVVSRARRNALGKFAAMIGDQLPRRMLFLHRMNFYFGAIHRAIVRAVSSTKNKSEMFSKFFVFSRERRRSAQQKHEAHDDCSPQRTTIGSVSHFLLRLLLFGLSPVFCCCYGAFGFANCQILST